jgi:Transglutaminase-like superfamily
MKATGLILKALYEIIRYEVVLSLRGSGRILSQLKQQSLTAKTANAELEKAICDAVLLATCFYWKPVLCLQRAVCTVRLLRRHGIHARLVIGYRPSPFFSHAWVEVNGRVVYGSPAYQKRLLTLHVA